MRTESWIKNKTLKIFLFHQKEKEYLNCNEGKINNTTPCMYSKMLFPGMTCSVLKDIKQCLRLINDFCLPSLIDGQPSFEGSIHL